MVSSDKHGFSSRSGPLGETAAEHRHPEAIHAGSGKRGGDDGDVTVAQIYPRSFRMFLAWAATYDQWSVQP